MNTKKILIYLIVASIIIIVCWMVNWRILNTGQGPVQNTNTDLLKLVYWGIAVITVSVITFFFLSRKRLGGKRQRSGPLPNASRTNYDEQGRIIWTGNSRQKHGEMPRLDQTKSTAGNRVSNQPLQTVNTSNAYSNNPMVHEYFSNIQEKIDRILSRICGIENSVTQLSHSQNISFNRPKIVPPQIAVDTPRQSSISPNNYEGAQIQAESEKISIENLLDILSLGEQERKELTAFFEERANKIGDIKNLMIDAEKATYAEDFFSRNFMLIERTLLPTHEVNLPTINSGNWLTTMILRLSTQQASHLKDEINRAWLEFNGRGFKKIEINPGKTYWQEEFHQLAQPNSVVFDDNKVEGTIAEEILPGWEYRGRPLKKAVVKTYIRSNRNTSWR
jgi:hypothetical protein